jgi:hypothetical protein
VVDRYQGVSEDETAHVVEEAEKFVFGEAKQVAVLVRPL